MCRQTAGVKRLHGIYGNTNCEGETIHSKAVRLVCHGMVYTLQHKLPLLVTQIHIIIIIFHSCHESASSTMKIWIHPKAVVGT